MSGGSRFGYGDYADPERGAAIIEGGDLPVGYVAAEAAAGFVLDNLLHHDRHTVVKVTGTNSVIDVDLGQARPVGAFGLLNVFGDGALPAIHLWSSEDDATYLDHGEVFDEAGWSGLTNRVYALPAVYQRRYWRIQATTGTDWTAGKVFLGDWFDLGDWYSPGASYQTTPPMVRNETASGVPVVHVYGAARERFVLPFNDASEAFRDVAVAISALGKPFIYVWPDDGIVRHVRLESPPAPTRTTAQDSVWGFQLAMETV